jgi:O-antigen ligase
MTLVQYSVELVDVLDAIRFRARFLWIFIIAWWLGGTHRSLLRILGLSLIGFLVLLATGYEGGLFSDIQNGRRISFGMNPQHFSLYAATALCCCLLLAADFWGGPRRMWRVLGWSLLVFLLTVLTIVAQSRSTWLALTLVALFWGVWLLKNTVAQKASFKGLSMMLGTLILLLTIPAFLFYGTFKTKNASDIKAFEEIVSSDFSRIETSSSLGVRIAMWKWSLQKSLQHPLIGWKIDNTSREFLGQETTARKVAKHNHVHNSYLEALLNQGLIGLLLFLFFPCYVIVAVFSFFQIGEMPFRLFVTFCSIAMIFGIVNIFEAYFTSSIFWPYFTVIFGGFYSLVLWNRMKQPPEMM